MRSEVSVILPYYEGSKWLRRSVESVLKQEGVIWELIVVDDGSSQPPDDILHSLQDDSIRLYHIPHAGKGAALNKGAKEATADILCFIDQDDVMIPGRLRLQYDVFLNESHVDVVYSDYERVRDDGRKIDDVIAQQTSNRECLHILAKGISLLSMQTIMIRRTFFSTIGGFSEDIQLTGLDDAEFMVRLLASGASLRYAPGIVQQWISHENNYMKSKEFHDARLVLLDHLTRLAKQYPVIEEELSSFQFNTYYMRGLYCLENDLDEKALPEFIRAAKCNPFQWNTYYLFLKSLLGLLMRH